ncbi:hypothetical protein FHX42_000804 [Saccharopolyspora lacisalsi]|uniref:MazF family transcriptional regulator n=1 Tax=Halosaccharopolyspora lacisalsi TaxID=1000566 RepID=A0A839DVY9_9PSEU|nr:MazF family transcriptional regulator [Halosaccharopolyspora lacisalsi]MBA8823475.1 hypothetical protein [Halosaccharopolyspora lacisalsi]
MNLLRGQVWESNRSHLSRVLVLSGSMYNSLPDIPNVLVLPVVTDESPGGWTVSIGGSDFVVVDRVSPFRKAWLTTLQHQVDTATLTNINNALFKILATE